jgi:hypothetical protein
MLCDDIFAPYILSAFKVHVKGCQEDAAAREHQFLICPATCIPYGTYYGLAGEDEGDGEVKALYLGYLLFGIPSSWADAWERIMRGGATRSEDCEHGAAVDKLHYADLHCLVLRVILHDTQRVNPQVPLAKLTDELNGIQDRTWQQ